MPMNKETHQQVGVILPKELYAALKQLADKNHRSLSAEINIAIEKYLEKAARK